MADEVGKKVFFLNPHSVIQDELVYEIVKNEYESYLVFDHKKLVQMLREFTEAIVFINVDADSMSEPEWERYVKNIMQDNSLNIRVGILTYNSDPELARKYLMDLGVPCGFVVLKLGLEQSRKIILKTLDANEARGQRKYVRAVCIPNTATFNVKYVSSLIKGSINDISSVGMSCFFDSAHEIKKGTLFKEMQLILKGKIVRVDAVVMGKRDMENGKALYVMLFGKAVAPADKEKIHKFIYEALQHSLDNRMGVY